MTAAPTSVHAQLAQLRQERDYWKRIAEDLAEQFCGFVREQAQCHYCGMPAEMWCLLSNHGRDVGKVAVCPEDVKRLSENARRTNLWINVRPFPTATAYMINQGRGGGKSGTLSS